MKNLKDYILEASGKSVKDLLTKQAVERALGSVTRDMRLPENNAPSRRILPVEVSYAVDYAIERLEERIENDQTILVMNSDLPEMPLRDALEIWSARDGSVKYQRLYTRMDRYVGLILLDGVRERRKYHGILD